ncbi:membrane hypothetical protein [Candidatus Sulfopaludibacter sp. SbA4]|nr:membrane hypothetical protein [Candidatus Sulfopaludibacter sp. SbA4]
MYDPAGIYAKHPLWYNNIDGVGELGMGFMLLGLGLLGWLGIHAPKGTFWNQGYANLIFLGVMSAVIHYGNKAIKQRITYSRTGFVEYRKRDTVWRPMILGALFAILFSFVLKEALRPHRDLKTLAAVVIGLLFTGSYAYSIARTVRWKWMVVPVLALGFLTIALLPADLVEAVANHSRASGMPPALLGICLLSFLFYGAVLLVSGAISFSLYLRHNQPPAEEAQ